MGLPQVWEPGSSKPAVCSSQHLFLVHLPVCPSVWADPVAGLWTQTWALGNPASWVRPALPTQLASRSFLLPLGVGASSLDTPHPALPRPHPEPVSSLGRLPLLALPQLRESETHNLALNYTLCSLIILCLISAARVSSRRQIALPGSGLQEACASCPPRGWEGGPRR